MSTEGLAELDAMIAKARALGAPDVGERVAAAAAPLVDHAVKRTAAAGETPLGKSWKPKKDGGRPLVAAAAAIATRALERLVVVTLSGPTVWHHKGARGMPRRQVIPDGASVPRAVYVAALEGARRVWTGVLAP